MRFVKAVEKGTCMHGCAGANVHTCGNTLAKDSGVKLMPTANIKKPSPGAIMLGVNQANEAGQALEAEHKVRGTIQDAAQRCIGGDLTGRALQQPPLHRAVCQCSSPATSWFSPIDHPVLPLLSLHWVHFLGQRLLKS